MIFAVLQGVLTSCGTSDKTESKAESKNDTETVSLKDDFYTAVNYDWLESADIPENGLNSDYYDICSKNISEFYKNYVEGLSSKKELSKQESRLLVLYEQFMEGQYEPQIQQDVQHRREDKEHQRRTAVAHCPQITGQQVIECVCNETGGNDGDIGPSLRINIRRRVHPVKKGIHACQTDGSQDDCRQKG